MPKAGKRRRCGRAVTRGLRHESVVVTRCRITTLPCHSKPVQNRLLLFSSASRGLSLTNIDNKYVGLSIDVAY